MSDKFSFFCDLDRSLPWDERAALTVSDDGEHIVFNFGQNANDTGREVYLTPDVAANVAHLLDMLTAPGDNPFAPAPDGLKAATKLAGVVVLFTVAVGAVAAVVSRL